MSTRIFLAGLFHETNSFVEKTTTIEAFKIIRGEEILGCLGDASPMDGFLDAARGYGWKVVPGIDYRATPSGPVADEVFEKYWAELREKLELSLSAGLDAIFLVLHGAMVTQSNTDPEGELLERIRLLPGAHDLPLFAVLDLHANVSRRMAENASALIPYRENPHTDARETAVRAARHLWQSLTSRKKLHTHLLQGRVVLAPPSTGTADSPMRELEAMARALEKSAGHWEIGVAAGFAHSDTPDTGLSFWVVSDRPEISCHKTLESLYQEARSLAAKVNSSEWPLDDAIAHITKDRKFPALLVEPADNIGGGAPGDATFILRALLPHSEFQKCGVIINDPEAVVLLSRHSAGETIRLALGGKGSRLDQGPVDLEVRLERLSDGAFELEDKQSHLASMSGVHISMGPSAVVTHKHLTILITSKPTPPFDLGQWRSQGVEPKKLEVIGVKAAVAHRRAYDPITGSTYTVSTPGPCTSDLASLPYEKLRRPVYPLDSD